MATNPAPVHANGRAHPRCWTDDGHVCRRPTGRTCIEPACDENAGTSWGPLWCPDHDVERLERISNDHATLTA